MNEILQKCIEAKARDIAELCPDCNFQCKGPNPCIPKIIYEKLIEIADFALQNQWISVEEGLPPYDKEVIGMDYMPELALEQTIIFVHRSNNPNVITDKNKFCVYPPSFCKVTHWMPIPSLEGG